MPAGDRNEKDVPLYQIRACLIDRYVKGAKDVREPCGQVGKAGKSVSDRRVSAKALRWGCVWSLGRQQGGRRGRNKVSEGENSKRYSHRVQITQDFMGYWKILGFYSETYGKSLDFLEIRTWSVGEKEESAVTSRFQTLTIESLEVKRGRTVAKASGGGAEEAEGAGVGPDHTAGVPEGQWKDWSECAGGAEDDEATT